MSVCRCMEIEVIYILIVIVFLYFGQPSPDTDLKGLHNRRKNEALRSPSLLSKNLLLSHFFVAGD